MNTTLFFNVLFDENESTSFAKHHKGTRVYDVDTQHEVVAPWATFFCINPLHPSMDLKPTEEYHAADKPRRADVNVVAYRNILVEMDNIPVEDQKAFVSGIKMPYTTAVFSGGKSVHYIISLETPISDEKAYRKLVERIHAALGGKTVVDVANKNPSRFSRFPNGIRHDKDNAVQTLLEIKERVSYAALNAWLLARGVAETEEKTTKMGNKEYTHNNNKIDSKRAMNGFTLNFIMCGAQDGERNLSLFKAACDLFKCGYDEDQVYDRLEGPSEMSGLKRDEIKNTIKSALRRVEADQE